MGPRRAPPPERPTLSGSSPTRPAGSPSRWALGAHGPPRSRTSRVFVYAAAEEPVRPGEHRRGPRRSSGRCLRNVASCRLGPSGQRVKWRYLPVLKWIGIRVCAASCIRCLRTHHRRRVHMGTPPTRPAISPYRSRRCAHHCRGAGPCGDASHTACEEPDVARQYGPAAPWGPQDRQTPSPDSNERTLTSHAFASRGNIWRTSTRQTESPRSRVSHKSVRQNRKSERNPGKVSLLPALSCGIFTRSARATEPSFWWDSVKVRLSTSI